MRAQSRRVMFLSQIKFRSGSFPHLLSIAVISGWLGMAPAFANSLLDSLLKNASGHDFISYFGFGENQILKRSDGLIEHRYYSKAWTSSLLLSVDSNGRVVHMKLGVPRPLIDDQKVCTRGRDIVKSFVLAAAVGEDLSALKGLADEIYVRGLDLEPIAPGSIKMPDSGTSGPRMKAYKVGRGPLNSGDDAVFLRTLPRLPSKASLLFESVMGVQNNAGTIFKNCRLVFMNENMSGGKSPIKLLWCDAWDEAYWKSHFAGRVKTLTPAKAMHTAR